MITNSWPWSSRGVTRLTAANRGPTVGSSSMCVRSTSIVREEQVPHSTALQARLAGRGRYLTGPLARYALSGQWLSQRAREAADAAGLGADCRNPFRSIVVRGVELVYAVEEALRLVENYEPPAPAAVACPPRAGVGCGATEAPRGTLFHRYELDSDGTVVAATHRATHIAEPGGHRRRPTSVRRTAARPRRPPVDPRVRAGHPQLRPVHLLCDPLSRSVRGADVSVVGGAVVIGVGNPYRRDDGVGPAIVERLRRRGVVGVTPGGVRRRTHPPAGPVGGHRSRRRHRRGPDRFVAARDDPPA